MKTTHQVGPQQVVPQIEAGQAQLIEEYNAQARVIQSLQATVDLVPSTGSAYSGVIEEYHDVPGFILAERPAMVRVIGQAPVVGSTIFDMVSDGQTFRIFIPSKNQFLVGSTAVSRTSSKPIENLRPQHVVDALFWPEIAPSTNVLIEQFDADPKRFYVLSVLRQGEGGELELDRKIWFDRSDLHTAQIQMYGPEGRLDSDINYSDWEPIDSAQAAGPKFPRVIRIWRPQDDYTLVIQISKLTVNQPITANQFDLEQPPGTQLVHVGEETAGAQTGVQP